MAASCLPRSSNFHDYRFWNVCEVLCSFSAIPGVGALRKLHVWKQPGQLMAGGAARGARRAVAPHPRGAAPAPWAPSWRGGGSCAARMNVVSVVLRPQMGSWGDVGLSWREGDTGWLCVVTVAHELGCQHQTRLTDLREELNLWLCFSSWLPPAWCDNVALKWPGDNCALSLPVCPQHPRHGWDSLQHPRGPADAAGRACAQASQARLGHSQ